MRMLLDTRVFLWVLSGSPRLGRKARASIDTATRVHVSAASIWEIAIKARLGKIDIDVAALPDAIARSGFAKLPVHARHAAKVAELPAHHQDPFDRLLVAQAMCEPLKLLTSDAILSAYSDLVVTV